ncbi:hypothetical protein AB7038_11485 [Morganella morganii]|uniref:hypothetical protein n=1 Tax=Morganella morganii TaxID=582 RepID=UPI0034E5630A
MNIQKIFNIFILASGIFIFQTTGWTAGTKVIFKTKVVVGTCEFDDSNDFNKVIDLTGGGYLMPSVVEKTSIKTPVITETFSYTVKCKNFVPGSQKEIKIQTSATNDTVVENGIFYSKNNETNTGFTLKACDSDNKNCQNSENNNDIAVFHSQSDDLININYHVSLVKRSHGVKPGISAASVSLIYLQD